MPQRYEAIRETILATDLATEQISRFFSNYHSEKYNFVLCLHFSFSIETTATRKKLTAIHTNRVLMSPAVQEPMPKRCEALRETVLATDLATGADFFSKYHPEKYNFALCLHFSSSIKMFE